MIISEPVLDPDGERWMRGELSTEEWFAKVLARAHATDRELQAVRAQAAPARRGRSRRR